MENEFRKIDIILAVILVVLMCVGIGVCIVKQFTGTGELTTANCNQYLNLRYSSHTSGGRYTIIFEPVPRFKVTDVKATVSVKGKSIGIQWVELSFSATYKNPYSYEMVLKSTPPSFDDFSIDWYEVQVTVISISGQFSRGK